MMLLAFLRKEKGVPSSQLIAELCVWSQSIRKTIGIYKEVFKYNCKNFSGSFALVTEESYIAEWDLMWGMRMYMYPMLNTKRQGIPTIVQRGT